MTELLKKLNKYIIVFIISKVIGILWNYAEISVFDYFDHAPYILSIQGLIDILKKLVVIILLILDFRKEKLKNVVLTCIAAFFYPLLGVVIFALLLLDQEKNQLNNITKDDPAHGV